ncbi:hypothetical protein Nepgr_033178 [Nepenthes gracilis]|uniref:Carboxymethylenebutenolidase homolog n=1 Tax=Nepenthes gracilis TaxID=150966 RepID=A0AAD3Y868_NEPGR|nr:hypothetical protein Nepgr_033178 [Nepenthes gracilis]
MMRPVSSSTSLLSAVVSCKTLLFIRPPLLRSRFPSSAASSLLPPASRSGNVISRRLSSRFVRNERCRASYKQIKGEDELNEEACELVNGAELIIGEGDDAINAYLFKAVKNNNGTGILLLSDIFGFEDSFTRDFAYHVACNGYNVLVPDLFRGDPWMRDQPRNLFEQWLSSQDPARVAKDIDASAQWMAAELVAAGISKKLGLIGFCFGGGRLVEALARDESSRFGTGVSFYGTRMDPRAAANVKVPVLFVSGNNDPLCPVGVLTAFEKIIGRGSKVVIFEGRGHGFAHRPESPEEDADADQAFLIMRNWLHDQLAVSEETPQEEEEEVEDII